MAYVEDQPDPNNPEPQPQQPVGTQPLPKTAGPTYQYIGGGDYTGNPGQGMGQNDWISKYQQAVSQFGNTHKGANPSVLNDPGYWARRIYETNGQNADWGYWQNRMMTPEGPPEGAGNAGPQQLNYQQQLAYINGKLGRSITPGEMSAVRGKFGGTENDATTTDILDQVLGFLRGGAGGAGGGPGYTGDVNRTPWGPGQTPPPYAGGPGSPPGTFMSNNPGSQLGGGAPTYQMSNNPGMQLGGGGTYGGTHVFNDPATQSFEDLLNQRIQSMLQPNAPGSMGGVMDYLQKYFQQLQGPAYTPGQMDLLQTQALDPMTQQRDAARQQTIQRFAAQGITPSSGPVQQALQQIDKQYDQNRTATQANFAKNAVGLEQQRQGQAASLGPQMMGLEQQVFNNNETRANNAVNMAQTIPNMAWNRLQGAGNNIQQTNPSQLLQLLNQFQQQGYGQGQDFSNGLMQILPYLLQLFGGGGGQQQYQF